MQHIRYDIDGKTRTENSISVLTPSEVGTGNCEVRFNIYDHQNARARIEYARILLGTHAHSIRWPSVLHTRTNTRTVAHSAQPPNNHKS